MNKLLIAAAGSGKTTFLVDEALKVESSNVLITTYTEENEAEIKRKIVEKNKFIPKHITVQSWFSFLLQHGVRSYQSYIFESNIRGINLVNNQSAFKTKETNTDHFIDTQNRIYSDKVSKFVVKCNEKSCAKIINRLFKIYPYIFIDEVQDLAGYDLDFLTLLLESKFRLLLACDPRQGTYSTNNSSKNKKYQKENIVTYFDKSKSIEVDDTTLTTNYRSIPSICYFSNKLFSDYPQTISGNKSTTIHDGVFLVRSSDVCKYLKEYEPMQLRENRKRKIENNFPVKNFGESKGLSFERVLIYPTKPILDWLKNNNSVLQPISRSKFYVAITRAKFSIAFVYDYKDHEQFEGISLWDSNESNKFM